MLKPIIHVLLCLLLVTSLASPVLAAAEESEPTAADKAEEKKAADEAKKKKKKGRSWGRSDEDEGWGKPQEMGKRLTKKYQAAWEQYQQEQYDTSLRMLKDIRLTRLNEYERAKIYEMMAFNAYAKEDLKGAREYMQLALDQDALAPDRQADLQFNIARMYVAEQDWDNVVASLDKWFAMVEEPNSGAYNLLALAYYQKQDYDKAVEPAQKAVDLASGPNESWIRLLLALRLTRQEYDKAVPLLEMMVTHYPKKAYWLQLSTVHGALGSYEKALVPLQLAYTQGLLDTDAELRRLAQLMMALELPYQAAAVLEEGVESGVVPRDAGAMESLSNSWIGAREYEKAVAPLEAAADLDKTGNLYVRLAQVHIQREKWSSSINALGKGISKGGLDAPGDARLLMGIAHYSNKDPGKARVWFARATGYTDSKAEANTWVAHVDREMAATAVASGEAAGEGQPAPEADASAGAPADAVL